MFAGRVGKWERLQYRVRIEQPEITHVGGWIQAALLVPIGRGNDQRINWFRMFLRYESDDYGVYRVTYRIGVGSSDYENTRTVAAGSQELVAEWVEPRWYAILNAGGNPVWDVRWQNLRIYLNDEEIWHPFQGAGSLLTDDFYPAALPLGVAELVAEAQYGFIDPSNYNYCEQSFTETTLSTARVLGGYRVHDGDDWRVFPIHYEIPPLLDDPCDTGLDAPPPTIEGNTTWDASITPRDYHRIQNVYHGEMECTCVSIDGNDRRSVLVRLHTVNESMDYRRGRIFITPNLPREFLAMSENIPHEYLMYRAPLPRVDATRFVSGFVIRRPFFGDAEVLCEQTVTEPYQLHAARDELLYTHDGGAGNPLNDSLSEDVQSLIMWESIRRNIVTNGICGTMPCPVDWEPHCPPPFDFYERIAELVRVQGYLVSANCLPYYRHADHALRYLNTHAAPFWSYIAWLQDWRIDQDGDGVPEPAAVDAYWRLHQCQHIDHPALPADIRTRRRSYLLLDTLSNGTWRDWIGNLFGVPSGWVGSKRPELVDWLRAGELALNESSAPRWTAQNASLTFTPAGILVEPTSTPHTLEFDLADFGAEPYLYPTVADRLTVLLPSNAYTEVVIQYVSAAGDTVTVATSPGTHAVPPSDEPVYAGSWARPYQAELLSYSELGADWDADGVSLTTFAVPERAALWQLFGARAAATLRITVSQSTPAAYLMPYPRFRRDPIGTAFASDNGAHTFPHIRNAQTLHYGLLDYPLAGDEPSVRLPHQGMTLYDAAALYRQLELGLSAGDTDALLELAQAWGFDAVETGGSVASLRTRSRAALIPYVTFLKLWLINDLRECPPLPTLPTRRLDTTTYQFTGDWGQWVYFAAPNHRYYLSPTEPAHLLMVEDDTETGLTAYDRAVGRYHLTRQGVALDGTETLSHPTRQWRIKVADRWLARTTPHFSHALIPPHVPKRRNDYRCVAVDTRRQLLHVGNGVTLATYHLHSMELMLQRDYPGTIEQLERDSRQDSLLLVVRESGARVVYRSRDAGDTADEVLRMATEGFVIVAVSPLGLWCGFYQGADGRLKRVLSADGGQTWGASEDVLVDGAVAEAKPLDAWYDARAHTLMLVYERADGDKRVAQSDDAGLTFVTRLS